jgi:hypothetical protein
MVDVHATEKNPTLAMGQLRHEILAAGGAEDLHEVIEASAVQ